MAQPTAYNPDYDFSAFSTSNPNDQQPGERLDTEFSNLNTTLDEVLVNLALIQRDDGLLANASVHQDALTSDLLALMVADFLPRGDWATTIVYAVKDVVVQNATTYMCVTAHTSGVFATDLAAGKWMALTGTPSTVGADISYDNSSSALSATDVQDAIDELDAALDAAVAELGTLPAATAGANRMLGINAANDAWETKTGFTATAAGALAAVSLTLSASLTLDGATLNTDNTSVLNIRDNAVFSLLHQADATKVGRFDASGITTGTTRTLSFPDASGVVIVEGQPIGATTPAAGTFTTVIGDNILGGTSTLPSSGSIPHAFSPGVQIGSSGGIAFVGDQLYGWTGTIGSESYSQFGTLTGGALSAVNAAGPSLLNEAASNTNPVLIPNRANPTYGIGGDSGVITTITNGVGRLFVNNTGVGVHTSPSYNFHVVGESVFGGDVGIGIAPSYRLDVYENSATTHVRSAIRNPHADGYNATHILATVNRQWEVGAFDSAVGLSNGYWGVRDDTSAAYRFLIDNIGQAQFLGAQLYMSNTAGPALMNEAASQTNPTLIPDRATPATGLGSTGANDWHLISNGAANFSGNASNLTAALAIYMSNSDGAVIQNTTPSATVPTISPRRGDLTTGIGSSGAGVLNLITGGAGRLAISSASILSGVAITVSTATGPSILNEAASSTNPTLVPNQADPDTGMGWLSAENGSLIAGGVNVLNWNNSAAVGINQAPAGGYTLAVNGNIGGPNGKFASYPNPGVPANRTFSGSNNANATLHIDHENAYNRFGVDNSSQGIAFALGGSTDADIQFRMLLATGFFADNAAGPLMVNEAASSTNPTLIPNRADPDTGMGWFTTNTGTLVAGGAAAVIWNTNSVGINAAPSGGALYVAQAGDGQSAGFRITHGSGDARMYINGNVPTLDAVAGGAFNHAIGGSTKLTIDANTGSTGGAASAGAGNQYVELTINGNRYKLLHDGTV